MFMLDIIIYYIIRSYTLYEDGHIVGFFQWEFFSEKFCRNESQCFSSQRSLASTILNVGKNVLQQIAVNICSRAMDVIFNKYINVM